MAESISKSKCEERSCASFKNAFVYDEYRLCSGPFKYKYLYKYIYYAMVQPAYCTIVLFRMQQALYAKAVKQKTSMRFTDRFLYRFLDILEKLVARLNFILNGGFEANHNARVKKGLFIHHPQGIIIGGNTKIGKNCHLFKNVLFGVKDDRYPVIKDNVIIYANSVVLGNVTIHRNAVVAPNSVVIHDVEEAQIVAGTPARPIGINSQLYVQKQGIPVFEAIS